MIEYSDIESVIEACFAEMEAASRDKYDSDKADRTAALFLTAQMKLSFLIEEIEMKAKHAKNEITRIEGEKYFEFKTGGAGEKAPKITENMLASYVAKDPAIVSAKLECAKQEATLKKWNYVMAVLNASHIYYRNIGKNKGWAE